MEDSYKLTLRCKDFDSWISFLGRLVKIGRNYIIKNDIIIAVNRALNKKTGDKIPGKHIIRDPLSLDSYDFQEFCVEDGVYIMEDIDVLLKQFERVQIADPSARKSITYHRGKNSISMVMGHTEVVIAELLIDSDTDTSEEIQKQITATANSITWFNDLVEPIDNMVDNEWSVISQKNLIHIRNDGVLRISKLVGDQPVSSKLARSLFYMAGVTRTDTPIAETAKYVFLPSDQSDVAILRIMVTYKCGQSKLTILNCIHEYLALIYDDGKGVGEQ